MVESFDQLLAAAQGGAGSELLDPSFAARVRSVGESSGLRNFGTQSRNLVQQGASMGFFSSIAKFVGGALGAVGRAVGILPPAAAAAATAIVKKPSVIARVAGVAGQVATGVALGSLFGGGDSGGGVGGGVINPATGEIVGVGGGNGLHTTVTQVVTVNNQTGDVVKRRTFMGAPFLMNKEVAHLKTSARKLMRGAARVPRQKSGPPSLNSEITRAVKHRVLHAVEQGVQAVPA